MGRGGGGAGTHAWAGSRLCLSCACPSPQPKSKPLHGCPALPNPAPPNPAPTSHPCLQANAVAGPGFAQWTASGDALAQPFGDYGHKGANVNVQGFALVNSGLYGVEGLAQAIHTYGL